MRVGGEVRSPALLGLRVGFGALALFFHVGFEAVDVDFHACFVGHFHGEVDGEAVGVVEGKCHGAVDSATFTHLGDGAGEQLGAGFQGAQERGFFCVGDLGNAVEVGVEFWVGLLHGVFGDGQQVWEHGLSDAQQAHGADGAAQKAAQDVAAAFVAGTYAVADDDEGGAHVVGDNAHADVVVVVGAVGVAGEFFGLFDDGVDFVDFVHVLDALFEERHAFQAHAGVDVFGGKVAFDVEVDFGADLGEFELHEDEVPDFDVAVFVGYWAAFFAVCGAAVVVDFGAVAAGAGLAGVPEVVFVAAHLDAFAGHAGFFEPQVN